MGDGVVEVAVVAAGVEALREEGAQLEELDLDHEGRLGQDDRQVQDLA